MPETPITDSVIKKQVRSIMVVTPFSKYLALSIFIVLPLVFLYVGYRVAEGQIIQLENAPEVIPVEYNHARMAAAAPALVTPQMKYAWIPYSVLTSQQYIAYGYIADDPDDDAMHGMLPRKRCISYTEPMMIAIDDGAYHCINGVDESSFEVLVYVDGTTTENTPYARDVNGIYYLGTKTKADTKTFVMVDAFYFKDATSVYYNFNGMPLKHADPKTFESVSVPNTSERRTIGWYAKDKNAVYIRGYELTGYDPKSFVVLNQLYTKDATKVHYQASDHDMTLNGVDAATFVVDDTDVSHGHDAKHSYVDGVAQ